jgi:hypothetical protein
MDQAINQMTPEQRQAVMMQAQQEANQQIMQGMIEKMVSQCFETCAGTSVGFEKCSIELNTMKFQENYREQNLCLQLTSKLIIVFLFFVRVGR